MFSAGGDQISDISNYEKIPWICGGKSVGNHSAIRTGNKKCIRGLSRSEIPKRFSKFFDGKKMLVLLREARAFNYGNTLQEVGELFQVTRERIRQIEEKALLKLRSPYRSSKLREFADFVSKN